MKKILLMSLMCLAALSMSAQKFALVDMEYILSLIHISEPTRLL